MRAKIIDGEIVFAPRKIRREVDGQSRTTYNPTDEMLAASGWLLVVEEPMPDDAPEGYHYEPTYSEQNGEIVRGWELVEDPDPGEDEISAEEALQIILGGDPDEA